MDIIKQADWREFEAKYAGRCEDAFEALCRYLFKAKYGITDNLPYYRNHPGVETEPIQVGDDLIGFQSKYFENQIDADKIIASMQVAARHYPNLTKYIVYTNKEFSLTNQGDKPASQKKVEAEAKNLGFELKWGFGHNIIDAVGHNEMLYRLFFAIDSDLMHIHEDVLSINDTRLRRVKTDIPIGDVSLVVNRDEELDQLHAHLLKGEHVIITSEGGNGKTAMVKMYYEAHKNKDEFALYILNAGQLDVVGVNDYFRLQREYTLPDFKAFYQGCQVKIMVIDSAERLLDIPRTDNIHLLFEELRNAGWIFVFTCREQSGEGLRDRLVRDYQMQTHEIYVDALTKESLLTYLSKYHIAIPTDKKILERITNLFYLARYVSVSSSVDTMEQFREAIWNDKIKGAQNGPIQIKRERCFEQIVKRQLETNTYLINVDGLDADALYALKADEVIGEIPHQGYYVCHDIYVDWALDYTMTHDFHNPEYVRDVITKEMPFSYINAFKRYFVTQLDEESSPKTIQLLLDSIFAATIHRRWRFALLEGIALSKKFAPEFFKRYEVELTSIDNGIFLLFTDVLCTSCKEVHYSAQSENANQIERVPVGSGWEEAIRFVYWHPEKGRGVNYLRLLEDFASYEDMTPLAGLMAGQLALGKFKTAEDAQSKGMTVLIDDADQWSRLVCLYAIPLRNHLKIILEGIIQKGTLQRRGGYYDLINYILSKAPTDELYYLGIVLRDQMLQLLDMAWKEPKDKKHYMSEVGVYNVEDHIYGLNVENQTLLRFVDSSAFHTPILALLYADLKNPASTITLDYVIDFVDGCTTTFQARNRFGEHVEVLQFEINGVAHDVIASQSLWNMYRGTSGYATPKLLQSVLMAVEKYLFDMTLVENGFDKARVLLKHILTQSHSISLYSVVASLVMSNFTSYTDILFILAQNMRCLTYDNYRLSRETMLNLFEYGRSGHDVYARERSKSNKLRHRGISLDFLMEMVIVEKFSRKEITGNEERELLRNIVANLKHQVANMKYKTIEDDILLRLDYDSKIVTETITPNGTKTQSFVTNFPDELNKRRAEATREAEERSRVPMLSIWVDACFEDNVAKREKSMYHNKLNLLLEHLHWVEAQIVKGRGTILLGGDIYMPSYVRAMLITYEYDALPEDERQNCIDKVLTTLQNPQFIKAPLSRMDICLRAIPALIEKIPQYQSLLSQILIQYATNKWNLGFKVPYLTVHDIVNGNDMWNQYPSFMQMTFEMYLGQIAWSAQRELSFDEALSMLCLMGNQPRNRSLGTKCVDKLADIWNPTKEVYQMTYEKGHVSEIIADYVMNAPVDEVDILMRRCVASTAEILVSQSLFDWFVVKVKQSGRYDHFWRVWNLFYPEIQNHFPSPMVRDIDSYIVLQASQLNEANVGFVFDSRALDFYRHIAEDFGFYSYVSLALLRVVNNMNDEYQLKMLPVISLVVERVVLSNAQHQEFLLYAEQYVAKLYAHQRGGIRRNDSLNGHFERVLEYMRDLGSDVAAEML